MRGDRAENHAHVEVKQQLEVDVNGPPMLEPTVREQQRCTERPELSIADYAPKDDDRQARESFGLDAAVDPRGPAM